MKILITGCAGFIGSHLTDRLLLDGQDVVGIDNFNNYYDPKVKEKNLDRAKMHKKFSLYREDILNYKSMQEIFKKEGFNMIVHLAARAGVRPSINNPQLYANVNVMGTVNLLQLSVDFKISKFIFGSSSSVYGISEKLPFSEGDLCDKIISPYGASKRSAEFFVESFFRTHNLCSVILRFFTVYGPRGRPDMAPALFAKSIIGGKPISRFGDGSSTRDYTYVDDIIDGIVKTISTRISFDIINLGNSHPIALNKFIRILEELTGKKALIRNALNQKGDVVKTWANITKAKKLLDWKPKVKLESGLKIYLEWLKAQH